MEASTAMTAADVVGLGLRTSIFLIVFSLGLRATRADVLYLLSRPERLGRSLLAMNVVMPMLAVGPDALPASITEIAPAVLAHFGVQWPALGLRLVDVA